MPFTLLELGNAQSHQGGVLRAARLTPLLARICSAVAGVTLMIAARALDLSLARNTVSLLNAIPHTITRLTYD